jgi:hypothetical protein
VVDDGTNTTLTIDSDGSAGPNTDLVVITLDAITGATGATLVESLLTDNNLVVL